MIKTKTTMFVAVSLLLVGFTGGWAGNGWRMGKQLAEQRTAHVDQLRLIAEANAAVILQQQAEQQDQARQLAQLDTKHTEELSDALSENRRLENLYSAADGERRRLRIEVVVARNDAIVSETAGTGSVGDAASLELSGAAGRAVWDIRRSMIEDREKLEYLQEWAIAQSHDLPNASRLGKNGVSRR
ncbi:lysis system i-spanin subunit Rz [Halopseudomonas sp. SMJS2]|uniref:lysis system i-spanin subunit Rz n=1 Tax=Halopseudomonas sp. SMJS2 TaxID=3041098 RepID=UPI002452C3C2|nr:lysis system i-spanin subunit Rz [Halopseudomonas sp. SMJS2]WGK60489.1 lysis system i-spanin subunit Rz [Halopseudomonas sp. SMJS2]